MCAFLVDDAIANDEDAVCILDGRQSVRNDDTSPPLLRFVQSFLYNLSHKKATVKI